MSYTLSKQIELQPQLLQRLSVGLAGAESESEYTDRLWRNFCAEKSYSAALRQSWYLLNDRYLRHTVKSFPTKEGLLSAGYFDERLHPSAYKDFLTPQDGPFIAHRPVDFLTGTEGVVLVGSGCYAPAHSGHLNLMRCAKEELQKRGENVLGAYLLVAHQYYAAHKQQMMSAAQRFDSALQLTADIPWLAVDPFAVCAPTDLNFTLALEDLRLYLQRIGVVAEVVYVFGSDNASFSKAFVGYGRAVCVKRPGYEQQFVEQQFATPQPRVLWVDADTGEHSSTSLRVKMSLDKRPQTNGSGVYILRDDLDRASERWSVNQAALQQFKGDLLALLSKAVGVEVQMWQYWPSDAGALNMDVWDTISDSEETAPSGIRDSEETAPQSERLQIGRLFEISDYQLHGKQLIARADAPPLSEQIAALQKDSYTIVDDDSVSGQTQQLISQLLQKQGIRCRWGETLVEKERQRRGLGQIIDVVDARDFLLGATNGGLWVTINSQIVRSPYLFPYVNLKTRASFAVEQMLDTELWRLNCNFFALNQQITVADADNAPLWRALGFSADSTLLSVCQHHLNRLSQRSTGLAAER